MIESHRASSDAPGADRDPSDESGELAALRDVLLGSVPEDLRRLSERVANQEVSADEVGRVLPEAFRNRTDSKLTDAIAPHLGEALEVSIRRQPGKIADAIFPVLGPAIRRAIADTFSRLVQSLNQVLEHRFSARSLKWRLEAARTGKPFAEIVLLRTLLFRVEQVLLIHRESGLLLAEALSPSVERRESDLISGMLTAIQDFVRDSFSVSDEEALDTLKVGGLSVWFERGPHAVVACVVRGAPPTRVRTTLQEAVETIHRDYGRELAAFNGDATTLEPAVTQLEDCLLEAGLTESTGGRAGKNRLAWVGLAVVGVLLSVWFVAGWRARVRWRDFVEAVSSTPGLVVLDAGRAGGQYFVRGLRDPHAGSSLPALTAHGFEADDVDFQWNPYYSLEGNIVLARVRAALAPPAGVELALVGTRLVASGSATVDWLDRARVVAPTVPGVSDLETESLDLSDRLARNLAAARETLAPPDGVELALEDGVLLLRGVATAAWLDEAELLGRGLEGVREVRTADVEVMIQDAEILRRSHEVLSPPPGVELRVERGVLDIRGSAPHAWVEDARLLVATVPDLVEARFQDLEDRDLAAVLQARATLALRPPPSVELRVEGSTLVASGQATADWVESARRFTPLIPGLEALREEDLNSVDVSQLDDAARAIESFSIHFDRNSSELAAAEAEVVQRLVEQVRSALETARLLERELTIEVLGASEATAGGSYHEALSRRRAHTVLRALVAAGVDEGVLTGKISPVVSTPTSVAQGRRASRRQVGFRVLVKKA